MGKKISDKNLYLHDPETRKKIIRRAVISSTEVEGVSRKVIEAGLELRERDEHLVATAVKEQTTSYSIRERKSRK